MSKDLALVKIDPPFEKNRLVQPIPINDLHKNLVGKEVLTSGWPYHKGHVQANVKEVSAKIDHYGIKYQYRGDSGRYFSMNSSDGSAACFGGLGGNKINKV